MKITNQTQRLIKVGPVIVLPNDTVEVDATLEQYPALADLAKKGDITVEEKATKKATKKATVKAEEKDTEEGK